MLYDILLGVCVEDARFVLTSWRKGARLSVIFFFRLDKLVTYEGFLQLNTPTSRDVATKGSARFLAEPFAVSDAVCSANVEPRILDVMEFYGLLRVDWSRVH